MTRQTFHEYLKEHWDEAKNVEFRPHASYNEIGDQIQCYWNEEYDYTEQINPYLRIHKAPNSRIVGVTICGVKQMLNGESVPPREV